MAVRFYIDNWLMASSAVGLARVLKHTKKDIEGILKDRIVEIPDDLWMELPKLYASYILKDFDSLKEYYEELKDKKEVKFDDIKNPYFRLILAKLGGFYNNSEFTNPSRRYIKEIDVKNKEILRSYSENPKDAIESVLKDWENYKKRMSDLITSSIQRAFEEILSSSTLKESPLCFLCRERPSHRTLDAKNFTPLSASPDALSNFFYNGKNTMYLCKECETFLYFARFGFTQVDGRYLFIYLPEDIKAMLSINDSIESRKWLSSDVVRESLVEVAKGVEKEKADWILRNIYVVEIQPVGEAKSNIYTFSLRPELAEAIKDRIEKYPKSLEKVFDIFLKYVYQGKSLYEMLYRIMSGYFFEKRYKDLKVSTDDGRLLRLGAGGVWRGFLFLIKFQEVLNMQTDKDREINWAYMEGKKLAQLYRESMEEGKAQKKIETLSYRLLEAVRRKDVNHFSQNLIRAYLEVEKPIPSVFLNAIKEGGLERIAYAFLIGLNGREGKDESEREAESSVGEE